MTAPYELRLHGEDVYHPCAPAGALFILCSATLEPIRFLHREDQSIEDVRHRTRPKK